MIHELERVILTETTPGLKIGDVGTVVMVHGNGLGYEVEFSLCNGDEVLIETLTSNQIRPINRREMAYCR